MHIVAGASEGSGLGDGNDQVEWLIGRMRQSGGDITRTVGPVVGLAVPALTGTLSEWQTVGSLGEQAANSVQLTLSYGSITAADGPYLEVRTAFGDTTNLPSLPDVLGDERDRLFDHAGIDEPDPVDGHDLPVVVALDDLQLPMQGRREGLVWVGNAPLPPGAAVGNVGDGAAVTVVARGLPADQIRLTVVHDLAPFMAAAEDAFRDRLAVDSQRTRPAAVTPPGLEGHQRLIESVLADTGVPGRRYPRRPAGDRALAWDAAVLGQMHLAGQSRPEADHAVTLLVNQLTRLAATAAWWGGDHAAAIPESIRYTAFDSDVASRPAQLAWPAIFDGYRPAAANNYDSPAPGQGGDPAWLDAWNTWHVNRRS